MLTTDSTGPNQFLILFNKYTNCIAMRHRCFGGIFQQIAPVLDRCIYCLLERRIQQEKHVPQLKEQQWLKTELNN
jgi:hypothetical protein